MNQGYRCERRHRLSLQRLFIHCTFLASMRLRITIGVPQPSRCLEDSDNDHCEAHQHVIDNRDVHLTKHLHKQTNPNLKDELKQGVSWLDRPAHSVFVIFAQQESISLQWNNSKFVTKSSDSKNFAELRVMVSRLMPAEQTGRHTEEAHVI